MYNYTHSLGFASHNDDLKERQQTPHHRKKKLEEKLPIYAKLASSKNDKS